MKSLRKNCGGQIRVIEAFFASILLLSSLTLIQATQSSSSDSTNTLVSMGYNVLLSLDSNGHLASLVSNKSWASLKSAVQSSLSPMVWFNLTVLDENMICINDVPICSGSAVSDKIVSVNYVCVSTSGNYAVYVLRLQLALVD
ncbi:MAG: hypothetical protein ACPLKZ_02860 [Candidatus Bathyarchaeales archaeon]